MLDMKTIRENPDAVRKAIRDKKEKGDVDAILASDERRRKILTELEALRKQSNDASKEIGRLMKEKADASEAIRAQKEVSAKVKEFEAELRDVEDELETAMLVLPNLPASNVPVADDEDGNEEVSRWGEPREFSFEPKSHADLGKELGILDIVRAASIAGSGFSLTLGAGARLERALVNFMLDLHTREHGYREIVPPVLANRATMTGTGQLPKLEDDMYQLDKDGLFLIPTAEVPLTNLHQGEILEGASLPRYYTAQSSCFRREAGAAGKDTTGMTRVHQFTKVEMVKLVAADDETAESELGSLVGCAEAVLRALEIPYRVLRLCTGDLSFASRITYDLEAWAPGAGRFLEVSSCSEFGDFQSRRCNTRYRDENGKARYVRTLNGSGLAIPRTWICVIENYQREDGSVQIPEALVPYMGGVTEIRPEE